MIIRFFYDRLWVGGVIERLERTNGGKDYGNSRRNRNLVGERNQ